MSLSAKLVVIGGEVKSAEINLRLPTTIGRGRGATIMLPHPLVSRQHCELFESGGRLMVRDLGSLNGTFINNQRITESVIEPGELLTVGAVTFRAVYEPSDSPTAPATNAASDQLAGTKKPTGMEPTVSAEEILDVEIEELPPGGAAGSTVRPEATAGDVLDVADIDVEESASRTTMPRPGQIDRHADEEASQADAPEHSEGEDEGEDDLEDFLRSLGQK